MPPKTQMGSGGCSCRSNGIVSVRPLSMAEIQPLLDEALKGIYWQNAMSDLEILLKSQGCGLLLVSQVVEAVEAHHRVAIELCNACTQAKLVAPEVRATKNHRTEAVAAAADTGASQESANDVSTAHAHQHSNAAVKRAQSLSLRINEELTNVQAKLASWCEEQQKRFNMFLGDAIERSTCSDTDSSVDTQGCVLCLNAGTRTHILRSGSHSPTLGFNAWTACNFVSLCGTKGQPEKHHDQFDRHERGFLCLEPNNPDRQTRKWVSFTTTGEVMKVKVHDDGTRKPITIPSGPHCAPLHERAKKVIRDLPTPVKAVVCENLAEALRDATQTDVDPPADGGEPPPSDDDDATAVVFQWLDRASPPRP